MKSTTVAGIAEEILRARKRPLHYLELTRLILEKRTITSRTPANTVSSVLATDARFKRVAEGVYALAGWKKYPAARFAKDIAYDVLKSRRRPMTVRELGKAILKEREFKGPPSGVVKNILRADSRFYVDRAARLVGLSEWKK